MTVVVGTDCGAQQIQMVAAFEHTDDATCRKAIGHLGQDLRDGFVGRWLQRQVAERIAG